jgi:DNA mismatch endonuclease (patch repair protein)
MSDVFTRDKRKAIMQAIRGKDTLPELAVRRSLHALGYRFRLHVSRLPGKPDLVFPRRRCVLFVHGCFWHRHRCRKGRSRPGTRSAFWDEKFRHNSSRDAIHRRRLRSLGWSVLTVWECELTPTRIPSTVRRIASRLDGRTLGRK